MTYSRVALLEEAIESFLRQDFQGPKELIVLNDCDDQLLEFDHPEVTVVNVARRMRSLGEKRAASVALAKYDTLAIWDDDDIYLPHRLRYSYERMQRFGLGFFNLNAAFGWSGGGAVQPISTNSMFGACMFTRAVYARAGGFPPLNVGEDVEFIRRAAIACADLNVGHRVENHLNHRALATSTYYIYRWHGFSGHVSAVRDEPRALQVVSQLRRSDPQRPTGRVTLRPRWRRAYDELCHEYLASEGVQPGVCLDDVIEHLQARLVTASSAVQPVKVWLYGARTVVVDYRIGESALAVDLILTPELQWLVEALDRRGRARFPFRGTDVDLQGGRRHRLLQVEAAGSELPDVVSGCVVELAEALATHSASGSGSTN